MTSLQFRGKDYQRRFATTFWGITDPQKMKEVGYRILEDPSSATRLMLGGFGEVPTPESLNGLANYLSREALISTKGKHCSETNLVCSVRHTSSCIQVFCCCQTIANTLVTIQKKLFYNNARLTLTQQRDSTKPVAMELSLDDLYGNKMLFGCTLGAEKLFPALAQLQHVISNLHFTANSLNTYVKSSEAFSMINTYDLNVYVISHLDVLAPKVIKELAFRLYHNTTETAITAYMDSLLTVAQSLETIFQFVKFVLSPYLLMWNGVAVVATQDPWRKTCSKLKALIAEKSTKEFAGRVVKIDPQYLINTHGGLDTVLQNIYNSKLLSLYDTDVDVDMPDNELADDTADPSACECLVVLNAISEQAYYNSNYMDELVADFWEYCDSLASESVTSITFTEDPLPFAGFQDNESGAWVSFSGANLELDVSPWRGMLIIQCNPKYIQTLQEGLNHANYKGQTLYSAKIMCPDELVERSSHAYPDDEWI